MMPSIGFGVFQIPVNETERIVTDALEAGYRMIDTAASYFNEEQVGNALRHSGLKREDVFVTTKLWVQDYEYDDALRAFDLSMKKLGLDYLDLYLLHKPYGNYYAAWRAAERLYREGRIRAIGVTSFSSERLQDLFLHNEVKPAVNQLETHPFFQQKAANTFLRQEGIQHEAWAPFAEGQNDIWNNPVLKAIAARHGKTVGNVVLRWLNQRNVVVIPKTVRRERMIENLNIFDFTLTEEEMRAIAGLDTGRSPIYDDMDLQTAALVAQLHELGPELEEDDGGDDAGVCVAEGSCCCPGRELEDGSDGGHPSDTEARDVTAYAAGRYGADHSAESEQTYGTAAGMERLSGQVKGHAGPDAHHAAEGAGAAEGVQTHAGMGCEYFPDTFDQASVCAAESTRHTGQHPQGED